MYALHILVESEAKADDLYAQLQKVPTAQRLKEFKRLASLNSIDTGTARRGGDIGPFMEGEMVHDFDRIAVSAPLNEPTRPFQTVFGWHIVMVTSRTLLDVKPMCEASLQTAINLSKGRERDALLMSQSLQAKEQYYQPVKNLLGESWGGSFLDDLGNVLFFRVATDSSDGRTPSVELHTEVPRPLFAPSSRPVGCYRSVRTTFVVDCERRLIAVERQAQFEGRGAVGRVFSRSKTPAGKYYYEPVRDGTPGGHIFALACNQQH